jgi:putative ATP-binding cassette transporter
MKLIRLLLRASRGTASLSVLAGALSGATSVALIVALNEALASERRWPMSVLLWSFVALLLAVPLSRLLSDFLLVRLGQKAVFDLRLGLSRNILAAPLRRIEALGPHRLMVALTDDITAVTVAIAELPTTFVNFALIAGCLIYLGWLAPILMAALLVVMALGIGVYRTGIRGAMRQVRRAREKQDELYGHFHGLTEGAKELKLHSGRREAFLGQLEGTARTLQRLNVWARLAFSVSGNWGSLLFFVAIGLAVFGVPRLSPGLAEEVTGFVLVVLYLRTPMQMLMNSLPQLGRGSIALDKVERLGLSLLDEPAEAGTAAGSTAPDWRLLEMRGVRHAYRGEADERQFTLGPLDIEMRPSEVVFLVGGNGSGKTTFAKVLTGLYTPEKGEILIDGQPVSDQDRESYRQRFSAIFSEFYLFERLLGLEGPDLDLRARRYLEDLQLARKVTVRDGALSTTALSRGQRKRLALLAAYLEDRPIYVFDEWAADQDPQFKEVFYRRLLPELKNRGKAVLVISHDDRYFDAADRILKLEQGQLIAFPEPADRIRGVHA